MNKFFIAIITFLPFLCYSEVNPQTWQIKDVGSIAFFNWSHALDINDNGQVLLNSSLMDFNGGKKDIWAIGNTESGLTLLPELSMQSIHPFGCIREVLWQKINGSDLVIGTREVIINKLKGERLLELVTWKQTEGIKKYTVTNFYDYESPKIAQCGNSDHVILTFNGKIFALKDQQVIDLSNLLLMELQRAGHNFHEVKWNGVAVNNSGAIFGTFEYFEKHPYKEKSVLVGFKHFFLDQNRMTVIELPEEKYNYPSCHYGNPLNNNNEILFSNGRSSWLWSIKNGFIELSYYNDKKNFIAHAIAVLDDGTIVFKNDNTIIFLENETYTIIDSFDNDSSAIIDFSNYPSLKLQIFNRFSKFIGLVNARKQVICMGDFFGENHIFLLCPK